MSQFSYVALDGHGVEQRGELDARDEREARMQLRALRLRPVRLVEGALPEDLAWSDRLFAAVVWLLPRSWMPIRSGDLASLYRQLSLMLRSGHTLAQALDASRELQIKASARQMVHKLVDDLRSGQALSQAMVAFGRPFTTLMVQLTASAEQAGEMDLVFERMATDLERKRELRRQVLNTMMYPVIVLFMAIGVFVFLAVSVVPRFASFIEGRGRDVPPEAQALLDLSRWMQIWGGWLGLGVLAFVLAMVLAWMWPPTRKRLDRVVLFVPVLGGLARDGNMTQIAWTLSLLVRSGTTALEALRVARRLATNHVYVCVFDEAEHRLLSGQSLARSLAQRPMPHLFRHMVAVGEGTGQLDLVLDSIAAHYRSSLEARIRLITSMVEPFLLILVGGVVGFVYYTFFKTLMSAGGGG